MLAFCVASLLFHILSVSAEKKEDDAPLRVPRCTSDAFAEPEIRRGVTILSVQAQPQYNYTSFGGGPVYPPLSNLNFCQVQIHLTHQKQSEIERGAKDSRDDVLVEIWLPLGPDDWNGRLQATGGGGFATGLFGAQLGLAVQNGWAAVSTDGGHTEGLAKFWDASWLSSNTNTQERDDERNERRKINWNLLHNFASRSIVDQILIGKSITEQYYGTKPHHSYWNGCSTGGRQGYAVAQKYPDLLDGILAIAPAISFVNLVMGDLWPQVAMNQASGYLSNCELEYFRYEAIRACGAMDHSRSDRLEDPERCEQWSPSVLIGNAFECEGQKVTVTRKMAEVVQAIHDGPGDTIFDRPFPGLAWGVPMTSLANITIAEDGTRATNPFPIAATWLQDVVLQGETMDLSKLDSQRLYSLWVYALSEFGGILNTDDPDLTKLEESGTKLLTWHGIDDEAIPYQHTINYRKRVEAVMGGAQEVDEYYRLFLAPGVEHCGGGVGPVPRGALDALVKWVEGDEPPETLDADMVDVDGDLVTRELCMFPATARYMGIGDIKRASTWTCVGGPEKPAIAEQVLEEEFNYGSMQQAPKMGGKFEPGPKSRDTAGGNSGRTEQI